jgi:hypothetical protein
MALENMASAFKGLPMGDLIGGPLNAACDAQVRLAAATVDFIRVVGFNAPAASGGGGGGGGGGGTAPDPWSGAPRTAKFRFNRPVIHKPGTPPTTDASGVVQKGTDPVIGTEEVEIEVPVLAIVKIPALSITTVDITFDMEVKSAETSKESDDRTIGGKASASFGFGGFSASVEISGSISTHKENTRSSDNSAKYHVEVHAVDGGMPEGLARVLDMLAQSVAPKSIKAA